MNSAKTTNLLLALLAIVALSVIQPGLVHAEIPCDPTLETEYACSYEIADPGIQRVPNLLKFQARISQAKLPVGDAVLDQVTVNLVNIKGVQCTEEFNGVRVRNSVLNLEIGHYINCSLDDTLAREDGLSFQVCIGGGCLKPIALGTVPYAMKANFAVQAQETHKADVAAQAHYAHRVTADRDLFDTNSIGTGYFDFYTHPTADSLYSDSEYIPYREGGFIQWAPVNQSNPTLNICSKDLVDDDPTPLSELVLYAVNTTMRGNASVEGNLHVAGSATIDTGLTVTGGGSVAGGLEVSEGSTLNHGVTVTDTALSGSALVCQGDAEVTGHTYLDGGATVEGGLTVNDSAPSGHDLVCKGSAQIDGGAVVANGLSVSGGGSIDYGLTVTDGGNIDGGLSVTGGSLSCSADSTFGAANTTTAMQVYSNATFGAENAENETAMEIYSTVNFHGNVNLDEPISGSVGKNSIYSDHIVNGEVKTDDLDDGAVTAAKLNITTFRFEEGLYTAGVYYRHDFTDARMCVVGHYVSDHSGCWFDRDPSSGVWTLVMYPYYSDKPATCEGFCL